MNTNQCRLDLQLAERFTETYRKFRDSAKAKREVECLRSQFPEIYLPIQEGDLLAGRRYWGPVCFSPEDKGLGGYFMDIHRIDSYVDDLSTDPETKRKWIQIRNFWDGKCTCQRLEASFPEEWRLSFPVSEPLIQAIPNYKRSAASFPLYRIGLCALDFERLLAWGLPGLKNKLIRKQSECQADPTSSDFLEAGIAFVDHVAEVALYYSNQASQLADDAQACARKKELARLSDVLAKIAVNPPTTFHEALQLCWLYSILADQNNYGRMDIYLGPFLERDLEKGVITEEEAISLLVSDWKLINFHTSKFNGRVYIGGAGRPSPATSDIFARLAIEASRRLKEILPQLSLRWHEGMDETILDDSLRAIAEGCTFPMLYNDDVNVPAVAHAFGVSTEIAERYVGHGCGEYILPYYCLSTPSGAISCLKILDLTLRNGVDAFTGRIAGLQLGGPGDFPDYPSLERAFKKQLKYFIDIQGDHQAFEYVKNAEQCAYVDRSLLYEGCLETGRALLDGGVRHLSGTLEVFGHINVYDSLYAIKTLVYEEKKFSLPQLVDILDKNYEGSEKERSLLKKAPKFGNDIPAVDQFAQELHLYLCNCCRDQKDRTALDSYLPVFINNEAYAMWGRTTLASADGRRCGEPMGNGGMPAAGVDQSGVSAVMHSVGSLDPGVHAGAVHNFKFDRQFATFDRDKFKALVKGYFAVGGTQCMITIVSRAELKDAKAHPERHKNLLVRVGGFSSRFIDLDGDVQDEIISRTLYGDEE